MSAIQSLSERHRYIAWLELGGAGNNEIAQALGLTPSWVSTVRGSPLYRALLDEMRTRVTDVSIEEVKARLMGEAMASVGTLIEIRDNADASNRRMAAGDLLDRTPGLSKIHKTENDDVLRIVLESDAVREIQNAIDEDEGRDPRQRAIPAVAVSVPQEIQPRTIDDFIAAESE